MRLKPKFKKISTLEQANEVLRDIGMLEIELVQIDSEAQKKIATIKTDASTAGKDIRKNIIELSTLLSAYANYNRDTLFRDKKTQVVACGTFGFRKSTNISIRKTTVDLLKKMQLTEYLDIKATANKDRLRELNDETLQQVDAVRKIKDDFFCEADREFINQELLKSEQ